jgi:hypothetical protein
MHKLILWAVISVTCTIGLVFWFMLTLQCQPVSFFWQQVRLVTNPHANVSGTCMSLDSIIAIAYVYSVTATLCDLTLGLLPVFLVWNLQMNWRTKGALAGILGMGCVYVFNTPREALNIYSDLLHLAQAPQSSFAFLSCMITKTQTSYVRIYPYNHSLNIESLRKNHTHNVIYRRDSPNFNLVERRSKSRDRSR